MKILDLFCGAGGFFHGFAMYPFSSHLAIDFDEHAIATYTYNHPTAQVLQKDINRFHSLHVEKTLRGTPDIIIASPPCEEFSKANPDSRKSAAERIYGEGTAKLLLDSIRLIGDLNPEVFIIENVAAILQDGGRDIITREFARVDVNEIVFNLIRAHRHGNPSKRLRVFISNIKLHLPRRSSPTVMETIGDLPSLDFNKIFAPEEHIPNHQVYPLADDKLKIVRKTRWGRGARHFRVSKRRSLPNWVRLFPDRLATSINGLSRYIHPYENRLLSVREHARLMSYPDSFIFYGPINSQYNQVGESVPPIVSQHIAEEVTAQIE